MDQIVCIECLPRRIAGYIGWLEVRALTIKEARDLTIKEARDFCLCGQTAFFHLKSK